MDSVKITEEVYKLQCECCEPNWDGYDAYPINIETASRVTGILLVMPDDIKFPDLGAEPDGAMTLEWGPGGRMIFSVSVPEEGNLACAWLMGTDSGSGVMPHPRATGLLSKLTEVHPFILEKIRAVQ